jgi:hypothetical protein
MSFVQPLAICGVRSGAVERTVRDIHIFEANPVPPAPARYRQAG